MLSRVSLILPFDVDSEKSMATVLVLLMLSAHLSVHSITLLMAVWILTVAVPALVSELQIARSSACVFDMHLGRLGQSGLLFSLKMGMT